MAGKGKLKIGAEVGFQDNLGGPLKCGDRVRHIITGKEGIISQYGVVKGADGTNYKLCDNFWEVLGQDDVGIIELGPAENQPTSECKEKTLADYDNYELITEVASRNLLSVFLESNYEDSMLADELRRRGYEVKAEKTIVVSL